MSGPFVGRTPRPRALVHGFVSAAKFCEPATRLAAVPGFFIVHAMRNTLSGLLKSRRRRAVSPLLLALVVAVLVAGCAEDSPRVRRLNEVAAADVSHVNDPDVQLRIKQQDAKMFSDVYELHREAEHEGKRPITPKLVKAVAPKYPFAQRWRDIQGFVWVGFVVDEQGNTTRVAAIPDESGIADPAFVAAAIAAVQKWKYEPGTLDGQAAPFAMVAPIVFQLK